MVRAGSTVTAGTVEDRDRVVDILMAAREDHPVGPPLGSPERHVLAARIDAFLASGLGRASLASASGLDVGLAICRRQEPGLFSESPWLEIEVLYVRPEYRRRGAGRLLLADQLAFAQELGLDRIVTQPVSGTRSEARFLSRLGFAPVGARRSVEVVQLARRLEPESPRRGIESLIKRRRALSGVTPPRGIPILSDVSEIDPALLDPAPAEETSERGDGGTQARPDAATPAAPADQSESSRQVRRAELMRRSSPSAASLPSGRTVSSTR
ncbi:MAG: hypothetical protein BGO96_15090 [Micrococcales bacterium 73-15]|nr:MAG: hypothetical protein BGO96_15090 [Micrococcales bacterium 73-15]